MDILLIDTGTVRREFSEPIGIETISPYITCAKVELSSVELMGYHNVVELLRKKRFNIIGISAKIGSFELVKRLVKDIESISADTVICIGDIYGTYAYEQVLRWDHNLICMIGEGEKNWPVLAEIVRMHGTRYREFLPNVKSIAYYDNGVRLCDREKVVDPSLARHPSRQLLKKIIDKHGIAHLEGSRGCIYGQCSFCGIVQKYGDSQWRPFPEDFIVEELTKLSDAGVISPYFTDEDFFGNDIARVERIAEKIISLKRNGHINPKLNFYFNMRVDSVVGNGETGYEKAKSALLLLKRAGLREVFIGVESGSTDQIRRYNKNNEQMKSIKAIMTLIGLGIDIDIGFILFDPFMTLSDLITNLDFILHAGIVSNYSRLAKKLRVEPLTSYAEDHCDAPNISKELDMNTVSFPYEFEDKQVERVYGVFSGWEKEDLDFIYNLQSLCRGEVPSEEDRNRIKRIISMYRLLDLSFLRMLAECERDGREYGDSISFFKDIRKQYDNAMMGVISDYITKYRV